MTSEELFQQWDGVVAEATTPVSIYSSMKRVFYANVLRREAYFIPDISGLRHRTARAMQERNPLNEGEQPIDSRQAINPPDKGADGQPKKLPLHIFRRRFRISTFIGNGSGAQHDHDMILRYKGMVAGQHQFTYKVRRTDTKTSAVSMMDGVLIAQRGKTTKPDGVFTVITGTDGKDPMLPARFKELSHFEFDKPQPA